MYCKIASQMLLLWLLPYRLCHFWRAKDSGDHRLVDQWPCADTGGPRGCDLLRNRCMHDGGCALAQFVTCHNNSTAASFKVATRLQDKVSQEFGGALK
jgi:hypothetical protein